MANAQIGGPWVVTATICEKVLQEQDGVTSLIRVVDRVTRTARAAAPGVAVPEEMPPFNLEGFWLVINLKSGAARGRHAVKIRPEAPSGQQLPPMEVPVHFEGEDRGAGIILQLQGMQLDVEGLYWFDVFLDDAEEPLTRVPLRLIYAPQR